MTASAPATRGPGGPHGAAHDLEDPRSTLPASARRLVEAAKHIILTEGLGALTLSRVARVSGENKAMTAYNFGNKAGLVAAVLDSVVHDEYIASRSRLKGAATADRAALMVAEMRRFDSFTEELRVFFELFPHALRDESLRRRLQDLYAWYFRVKLDWLPAAEGDAEAVDRAAGLNELLGAVIDGLAIQDAVGREGFAIDRPYRVLQLMLEESLPRILGERPDA